MYDINVNNIDELKKILERLKSYCFFGRMKGTISTEDWVRLFDEIDIKNDGIVVLKYGKNHKYITEMLQKS